MSLEGEIEEEKNGKNVAKDKPMREVEGEVEPNHQTIDYFSHRCCTDQYCNLKL